MGNPERRTNRTQVENLCYRGAMRKRGRPGAYARQGGVFLNLGVRRGVRYG